MAQLKVAHYDITTLCNLKCEGCYFFDTPEFANTVDSHSDAEWNEFFRGEAARGINLAMLAGAEPSLRADRLRLASNHIAQGVIYTNGAKKVPEDVDFRIHLSCWGVNESDKIARGANAFSKSLRHYRNDPRVIIIYTIAAVNVNDIYTAVELAHAHGLPITFSYYSPPIGYKNKIDERAPNDKRFFRISSQEGGMLLSGQDFVTARREIERSMRDFPDNVHYSLHYNDWIVQPDVHKIDPDSGLSLNCGVRMTKQENFKVDWTTTNMKCGSPTIDCATCKGYGPSSSTYFSLGREAKELPGGVNAWREARRIWKFIFMGRNEGLAALEAG